MMEVRFFESSSLSTTLSSCMHDMKEVWRSWFTINNAFLMHDMMEIRSGSFVYG